MRHSLQVGFLLFFVFVYYNSITAQYANDPFDFPQQLGSYVTNGIAWGDYDNDGDDDLYLSNGQQGNQWENHLYRNNGDGTFSDMTGIGPVVSDIFTSGGTCWGDYDNNGDLDLLVAQPFTRGSFPTNYSKVSLYINDGSGSFSDGSAATLTNEESSRSKAGGCWADWNNDGYIDVYISNAAFLGGADEHALYTNNQDGTFTEENNNLTGGLSARGGASWIDFEGDGDMDLVTVSGGIAQPTVLWINTGSDFTGYTLIEGGEGVGKTSQAASWGDYDNDGDMDLYIVNGGDSPDLAEANILFRNDGVDGNGAPILTQMDASAGDIVSDTDLSVGSGWADYDNDGDLDMFVGNDGSYTAGYRSRLYENNGDSTFTKKTNTIFADSATFSRSLALADYDRDGDMDVIVGRDGPNRLFTNTGNSNQFVSIKLIGVNANKTAIGSVVRVKATINGEPLWQMRDVNSQTGYGSHNSYRLHFGLGDATNIDSIKIEWAGSGQVDEYANLTPNDFYEFTEQEPSRISDQSNLLPEKFEVYQNYPNPFNPGTTIGFALPGGGLVTIDLFNASGENVRRIMRSYKPSGYHEVTLNAAGLASGIYFYRVKAGAFEAVKKLMLIK